MFAWLLPKFIDYEEVWEALTQLDAWEVAALLVLGLTRVRTEALMYRAFLPGLGLWRGSEAYLSSNFAGQLLPPPSVVQYGYFRGAGYAADAAGLAALGSFIFPTIGRFLLPLVAFVLLLFAGEIKGSIALAASLSLVVTAVAGIAGYLFMRGERSARRLGAEAQRPSRGSSRSSSEIRSKTVPDERPNCVSGRSPFSARGGRWDRSGLRSISSSPTSSCSHPFASSASPAVN